MADTKDKYVSDVPLKEKPRKRIGLKIKDRSITNPKIADGAVTNDKLADNAIDNRTMADEAVDSRVLQDNSVSESKLQDNSVSERTIINNSVTEEKLQNNSVSERTLDDKAVSERTLQDNIVSERTLVNNAVSERAIQDNAVSSPKIASNAVTTDKIADENVLEKHLAPGAVTTEKLSDGMIEQLQTITDAEPTEGSVKPLQSGGAASVLGYYIDNPEYVRVYLDSEDRILWGVKADGDIFFGAGVPTQVKDYIQTKLDELSLDEYEDIVSFLSGIINEQAIFSNKKVSIIGDSISTFNGYLPDGYPSFYPRQEGRGSDVTTVNDTWWMKLIDATGSTLEVNASYSGSTASSRTEGFSPRVPILGSPDIIIVALGTNDSVNNVEIGEIDFNAESYDLTKFAPAYVKGMKDIIATYPNARIICVAFDMGIAYLNTIKSIAEHYVVDYVYVGDISDIHPTKDEMQAVFEKIYSTYTLSGLLSGKVDKVQGKSLVDAEYANGIHYIKNEEFAAVWVDADERILFGVQSDGNFYFGCNVPSQIVSYVSSLIGSTDEKVRALEMYMKETYGELIDSPEWIKIVADNEGKILEGIKSEGCKEINVPVILNDSVNLKGVINDVSEYPQYIEVKVDSEGKILEGIMTDGTKFIGGDVRFLCGIPQQIKDYIDQNCGGSGISEITYDEETGDMYATYDDESGVTDVYMDENGDIYVEQEK